MNIERIKLGTVPESLERCFTREQISDPAFMLSCYKAYQKVLAEAKKAVKDREKVQSDFLKRSKKAADGAGLEDVDFSISFKKPLPSIEKLENCVEKCRFGYLLAIMFTNISKMIDTAKAGKDPELVYVEDAGYKAWRFVKFLPEEQKKNYKPNRYGSFPITPHALKIYGGNPKRKLFCVGSNMYDIVYDMERWEEGYDGDKFHPAKFWKNQNIMLPPAAETLAKHLFAGSKIKPEDPYADLWRMVFGGVSCGSGISNVDGREFGTRLLYYLTGNESRMSDEKYILGNLECNAGTGDLAHPIPPDYVTVYFEDTVAVQSGDAGPTTWN